MDNGEKIFLACFCMVVMGAVTALSIFNLKEERVEKEYIKNGYQQVFINNTTTVWQKIPQTESK